MVRDIQVKVAESYPNSAWADTDDLNDEKVSKGYFTMNRVILHALIMCLLFAGQLLAEEFFGYYTHIDSKEAFENASRTGSYSDIVHVAIVKNDAGRIVVEWR